MTNPIGLIEKCPHCLDSDYRDNDYIENMPDGRCGVCGGTGKIEWKEAGKIINLIKQND